CCWLLLGLVCCCLENTVVSTRPPETSSTPTALFPLTLTVRPGDNTTLHCDITNYEEVSWYRLSAKAFTLLISAQKTQIWENLLVYYNINKNHYILEPDSQVNTAILTIINITTDDIGRYFCGTKVRFQDHMQFKKVTTLQFEVTVRPEYSTTLPSLFPHTLTVRPGDNTTLHCDITSYEVVSWYLLNSSEEFTLLISAQKTRIGQTFLIYYKKNDNHFILEPNSEGNTAILSIVNINTGDLGRYFCGTKARFNDHMHFKKVTTLQFADPSSFPDTGTVRAGISTTLPSLFPHTLTVRPGDNTTLHCDITSSENVSLYLLRSEDFTLLISAGVTKIRKNFVIYFNKNENHFILEPDIGVNTAIFTIINITTGDLGLYFCGTQVRFEDHMHFKKLTTLQFK
ncbi:uncharacterized protein DAT39_021983, partial [Clarias magur]